MDINITLEEQEVDDENYEFFRIPAEVTPGFSFVLADFYGEVVSSSLKLLKEKHPEGNLDYLQCFTVELSDFTLKYYALSNAKVGEIHGESRVLFLLPSEY